MNPSRFIPILKEMRELVLKHNRLARADYLSHVIDLAHFESRDFKDELLSGDMWGTAGSIKDVVFEGNEDAPEEELRRDDLRYMVLLVQLSDEMKRQGIRHKHAEGYANSLRRYLKKNHSLQV